MPLGTSIRVYLADGTVTGIRHAEVVNWTGQAVACPRSRVAELSTWEEARRPGVYFLFGTDEATGKLATYIGEAENVYERLQAHLTQKDFWTEAILFTNKDENLTKAHVRYLEAKLIVASNRANRYSLTNTAQPQPALLPRGDRDAMDSFQEQIRILLGVLGHRVLEPVVGAAVPSRVPEPTALPTAKAATSFTSGTEFRLSIKGIEARAVLTDEGVAVLSGSDAASVVRDSLSFGYRNIRAELVQQGVLAPFENRMRFTADHLFSSPSAAAAIIVGYMINGRDAWKTQEGVSLGQLEQIASTHAVAERPNAEVR